MKPQNSLSSEVSVIWQQLGYGEPRQFVCGFCSANVASERGYFAQDPVTGEILMQLNICHLCSRPTFFDEKGLQHPPPSSTQPIQHIVNPEIRTLLDEARRCLSVHAHTAAYWCCKKILILVCRDKGQNQIQSTSEALDYLKDSGHIPPALIEATETIQKSMPPASILRVQSHSESLELYQFTDIILRLVYELPQTMRELQSQSKRDTAKVTVGSHTNQILNKLQKGYIK